MQCRRRPSVAPSPIKRRTIALPGPIFDTPACWVAVRGVPLGGNLWGGTRPAHFERPALERRQRGVLPDHAKTTLSSAESSSWTS
jgi:hypothetical protein